MKRTVIKLLSVLVLLSLLSAVLVGCGESEPVGLIFATGGEPVELDPADAIGGPAAWVIDNVFDRLVEMTEDGEIVPALAESWSVSDDQLTWTFELREDVEFHDGAPFDAEAVKYNFDRVLDPDLEMANLKQWEPYLDEVTVVDEYTISFTTKEPYGSFLNRLANSFSSISSPEAIEEHGDDYTRNPVGAGPFMMESWMPGERIVLVKNPNYWREGPYIDRLEYRFIPEGNARVLALEGGDVDVIDQVPAQDLSRLEENPELAVTQKTMYRIFYWAFNHTKDVWVDPQVRIALNHAIDRESIVENVLFGAGEVANSFLSPSVDGSLPIDDWDYDPDRARDMLEEAGFDFDQELVCYVTEGRYFQDRQVAEAMQGMLAEIGVNVDVQVLEWGAFVDAVWFAGPETEVAQARDFAQTTFGSSDPATAWRQTLHSEMWPTNGWNEAFYANDRVDQLIDEVNRTTDQDERRELLEGIQREFIADPPWIISHFEQAAIGHKSAVQDLVLLPGGTALFRLAKVE